MLIPLARCGIDSPGNVPIFPACVLYMNACTCTYVLCLCRLYGVVSWPARAMYLSCPCLCLHVRTVLVPLQRTLLVPFAQCFGMTGAGNVPILPVLILARTYSYCACTIAQCVLLVPRVQCFGMANTGNVPILPVLVLARMYCACTPVQCFGMGNPSNVPILPACVSYLIAR